MHSSRTDTVRYKGHLRGGGVSAQAGCLPRGKCLPKGCLPGGCLPRRYPPVDRILDTLLWKHYVSATTVAGGNETQRITRLHSNRMRTACLLPLSPSMHCTGGCLPLVRGGVSASGPGGGCLLRGVAASGPGCVYPSMQWDRPPPLNRITDTCKNITLPQLHCGG